MSRTDKDAPYWVRAKFYEPFHMGCPEQPLHTRSWARRAITRECDLPAEPVRLHGTARSWRQGHCTWEPAGWDRRFFTWPPRSGDRCVYFHSPNRRIVRDYCTKAVQEYRGSGDVDTVEPCGRHKSRLDWWD